MTDNESQNRLDFGLRTRIAAALAETDGMPWDMWSKPSQDGYLLRADAVIRELQLTVLGDGIIVGAIVGERHV